jgi:undecaprenyl-diphosphatase
MSAPIILGDGLWHARKMGSVSIDKAAFFTAIITAAVVDAQSTKFLLDYLKKKGFGIFAVYRFILGAAVITIYFIK